MESQLEQTVYGSLSQEAQVKDLKEAIIALLAQAEDYDFRDKYTFGVVAVKADGRNVLGSADPDPKYFALIALDDFTDQHKSDTLRAENRQLNDFQRVQMFDTMKA